MRSYTKYLVDNTQAWLGRRLLRTITAMRNKLFVEFFVDWLMVDLPTFKIDTHRFSQLSAIKLAVLVQRCRCLIWWLSSKSCSNSTIKFNLKFNLQYKSKVLHYKKLPLPMKLGRRNCNCVLCKYVLKKLKLWLWQLICSQKKPKTKEKRSQNNSKKPKTKGKTLSEQNWPLRPVTHHQSSLNVCTNKFVQRYPLISFGWKGWIKIVTDCSSASVMHDGILL